MMFFGNIGGGLFVVLFHIIGVTNVDNFLRPPILVPREARLDPPALMLLAVFFSGIAMFGFWGHRAGPGPDDHHRHDDLGVPGRVQGRRDDLTRAARETPPVVPAES